MTQPPDPSACGRELLATAMARGRPARVPVMCQLALGHYFLHAGLDPLEIWHDGEAFAEALCRLQRRYGFDGILVNLPGRDPHWRERALRVEQGDGLRRIHWRSGRITELPPDDNPHVLTAAGEPFTVDPATIDPERLFYVEPHDIEGVDWPYTWREGEAAEPGESFFPDWQCDTLRAVIERTQGEVSVHAEVFSPFSQWMELVGYQNGLIGLLLDEGRALACFERLAEGATCLGRRYAAAGCDALLISSAFVGAGFVSRDHYARFELPFLRRIVTGVKELRADLPVYVHTCGRIGDRLDLMEQSGVDGIDTFDPPPIGTVDLRDAVEALGGRVFIKGNLDPVNTLLGGDVAAVRAAVRERLEIAGTRGGYVLSSACSVSPHTPVDNLMVLREEVEAFDG